MTKFLAGKKAKQDFCAPFLPFVNYCTRPKRFKSYTGIEFRVFSPDNADQARPGRSAQVMRGS